MTNPDPFASMRAATRAERRSRRADRRAQRRWRRSQRLAVIAHELETLPRSYWAIVVVYLAMIALIMWALLRS